MGGGIGVPPILELAKQMKCEKNRSLQDTGTVIRSSERNLRRRNTFILPQRMAVWEQRANVMDAIRENALEADVIYACGPTPMLRAIKKYAEEKWD